MSRCFPYPPPGYTLSRGSEEALIESIKLQEERQKIKEQTKKEKRREKKEKKRDKKDKNEKNKEKKDKNKKNKEKKDKTHQNDETCQNMDGFNIVHGHGGNKFWEDTKGEFLHQGTRAQPEQLERSSLSEEHGQPVCLRVPSSSSDSTENSNKRKRQSSPTAAARGHGKIIRIRLSSKGENQSNEQQKVCSTSGRIRLPSQNRADIDARRNREDLRCTSEGTSNMIQGLAFINDREQICSTSRQNETFAAAGETRIPSLTKMQRAELEYKNLTENWVPPQLQGASCEPEDLDWLLQGRNQLDNAQKRQISANDRMSCSSSSELFPRAKHLQEVDVYALPFTVPF